MKLSRSTAEIFVPDGRPVCRALARTTALCIAAHHDDIETMAPHQILACRGSGTKWFLGAVVTDGAGSPRSGPYKGFSDRAMRAVRREEQKKAAVLGEYGALVLLDHPSAAVKDPRRDDVRKDLRALLKAARPDVVVTHNLADRHDAHVALALRTIEVLRALPARYRPDRLYGGEVWRGLDWLLDEDKVVWDVSQQENLQAALIGVFDSQISGGKRYDLAVAGRRRAHATYAQSHEVDRATAASVAMDLTPLIEDTSLNVAAFAERHIERLRGDVLERIARLA